jgi:hypothetical protein
LRQHRARPALGVWPSQAHAKAHAVAIREEASHRLPASTCRRTRRCSTRQARVAASPLWPSARTSRVHYASRDSKWP